MGRIVTLEAHLRPGARMTASLKREVGFRASVGSTAEMKAGPAIVPGSILELQPGDRVKIGDVNVIVIEKTKKLKEK